HQADVPADILLPARAQNYISGFFNNDKKWQRIKSEAATREKFLTLFENFDAGSAWLDSTLDVLVSLQEKNVNGIYVEGLIHGDLRMDNVLFGQGRTYLIDWPNACIGPVLFDLVFLSAHLESLGIGKAEDFIAAYNAAGGKGFTAVANA